MQGQIFASLKGIIILLILCLLQYCEAPQIFLSEEQPEREVSRTFLNEERPGAMIFVDEALAPALQAAISLEELQAWAVTLMALRNSGQREPGQKTVYYSFGEEVIPDEDVPDALCNLSTTIRPIWFTYKDAHQLYRIGPMDIPPVVAFHIGDDGTVTSITVSWYLYGILIGSESFVPAWEPWYLKKVADGIYLYHIEK